MKKKKMKIIPISDKPCLVCPVTNKLRLVTECDQCDFYQGAVAGAVLCKEI